MPKSLEILVTGADELRKRLTDYPLVAKAAIAKGLRAGIMVLVREVKETIYAGHAAGHLEGDSGHLRRSIVYEVNDAAGEAQLGTNLVYAPPHEFGAVIKAKNAPYLMFPLAGYRTKAGKLTKFGKLAATGKAVNAATGEAVNRGGWVRVKQVTIPARPYLRPAIANKGAEAAGQLTNAMYEVLKP